MAVVAGTRVIQEGKQLKQKRDQRPFSMSFLKGSERWMGCSADLSVAKDGV